MKQKNGREFDVELALAIAGAILISVVGGIYLGSFLFIKDWLP